MTTRRGTAYLPNIVEDMEGEEGVAHVEEVARGEGVAHFEEGEAREEGGAREGAGVGDGNPISELSRQCYLREREGKHNRLRKGNAGRWKCSLGNSPSEKRGDSERRTQEGKWSFFSHLFRAYTTRVKQHNEELRMTKM